MLKPLFNLIKKTGINQKYSTFTLGVSILLFLVASFSFGQTETGTDSWVGHVYDDTSFLDYRGYITENKNFNENFGGNTGLFRVSSTGNYILRSYFTVRFRMQSTQRGLFRADFGSDDGAELEVDGQYVYRYWKPRAFRTDTDQLFKLTGSSSLLLNYFENGGGNRVSVSNFIRMIENVISGDQNICKGENSLEITGDAFANVPSDYIKSYQWVYSTTEGGTVTNILGATSQNYTPSLTSAPFNISGTYYVYRIATLTHNNTFVRNRFDNNNRIETRTETIKSNAVKVSIIDLPNTIKPESGGFQGTTYCQGEQNMQLTYNADDDNAYPYTITYRDETNGTTHQQVINGQGEETFTVATIPTTKGKHKYTLLSIKNKYGCENTSTILDTRAEITVRGYPKDVLSISLDTQTACSSETSPVITLKNSDKKNIIVTYTINSGTEETVEVDSETTINVPTTSAGLFTYDFTKVRYKSNPTCEDTIDIKKCVAIFPKNDTAPTVNSGAGAITVTPPATVSGFNIEYSFDDGATWGVNTPPTAEKCDGYKIKTRYKLADTSCVTTETLTCATSPATTRIVDVTKPTFTAESKSFCVRSLTSATYVDATIDIKPEEREDFYIIKKGATDLDISSLNDNCCAENELNLSWVIKDGATEKFSGTGQPSLYASDIKLEGNTSANKIYTVTYTLEDCNGNKTIRPVDITIKPRPVITKIN